MTQGDNAFKTGLFIPNNTIVKGNESVRYTFRDKVKMLHSLISLVDSADVEFFNLCTITHQNGIAFRKNQQLAWLNPVPVLIAQRLAGHDVSSFLRIYDLCQIDGQILATKSDNFVWSLTQ